MNRLFICTVLAASLAGAALAAEETRPLKLEFPPPKITSTPVPFKLAHLEAPNTPPPEVLVPADVKNLAAGKPVTSSDPFPVIGDLSLITDGDKESEDGYYVELGEDKQWVQIDLGAPAEIYAVAVWHFHGQARAYHDVVVQVSDDEKFASGVTTIFNNDHDNSSGLGTGKQPAYTENNRGRLMPAGKVTGRYVRLHSAGNTSNALNHYVEVEVFGRPRN